MGRIKTMMIKRVTNELVKKHNTQFTKSFEDNKKLVSEFADVPSKKLRNTIAGYVTRIIKNSKEI